jgi:hypothetical protein
MGERTTYLSQYVAQHVATWLEAQVHRLDTHAYWSAELCERSDRDRVVHRSAFFENYCCDGDMLRDWIKRRVVTAVSFDKNEKVLPFWRQRVEATLEGSRPFLSVPLDQSAEAHIREHRDPDPSLWYEAVVDTFADDQVAYGLTLWGYKYPLEGLSSSKDSFYLITDNLGARVRFVNRWLAIDESARELRACLAASHPLAEIRSSVEHTLSTLGRTPGSGLHNCISTVVARRQRSCWGRTG